METQTEETPVNKPPSDYKLEGKWLEVVEYPDPVLKAKALPVEVFDDDLAVLCKNMLYTMYKSPGR